MMHLMHELITEDHRSLSGAAREPAPDQLACR
jgi:hypothetical protein